MRYLYAGAQLSGRLAGRCLVACLLVSCGFVVVWHLQHIQLVGVETASMRPVFRPGDMLLLRPARFDDIRRGDVVTYRSPRNPEELITHRIIALDTKRQTFTTKGDALAGADPVVTGGLLEARATMVFPYMGTIVGWLRSWPGLTIGLYVPVALITVYELRRLQRGFSLVHYRLLYR